MICESLTIILAEDDEGHANLVQRNLRRAGIVNQIVHCKDGQETLDYLFCQDGYRSRTPAGPLLVLLDINMPRVDGIEVLRQLKEHERTLKIPVIMLTTTDDPREVQRCYELGCSVYVVKPVSYDDFIEAIKRLGLFLSIVKVPREDERA
jgi:CheY-like chemotaxis protein